MKNRDYITVGKIGATYGIKGWLKIVSFTEQLADILNYTPWYLEENQQLTPVTISDGRTQGKGIIAKIDGYDTPEQARLLTGKRIAIQRSQLPVLEKQEYYWADLEGLTVIDQHGSTLGKVIYLIATGSNDVLVVKGNKAGDKEIAIPYLPGDVIISIDLSKQVMHVKWDIL